MKVTQSHVVKLAVLAAVMGAAPQASAFSNYYSGGTGSTLACTTCHTPTVTTCAGCHAHGTHADSTKASINIVASADKTTYAPGETVTVTVTGGYRGGWVRVNLYDEGMTQLARSSCPGGLGGCTTALLPATLTAPAPTTPGTYTWRAAWYGNAAEAATGFTSPACGSPVTPPCFRVDPNNNGAGAVHGEEIVAVTQFTVAAAAAPAIALSPTSLAFGTVTVGGSVAKDVQVQNTGTAPLTVSAIALTGSAFTWSPAAPFTVPAGGSTTVSVTFTPTAAGAATGTLAFTSDDPAHPTVNLALTGTGQAAAAPAIAVSPTALTFGNVTVGTPGTQTFTVSNTGTATLTGTVAVAAGTSDEFTVSPTTFSIAAGAQPVTVTATYAPNGVGADSGALTVASNDPAHPTVSVTVAGAGVPTPAPSIALTPAALAFGNVVVGAAPSTLTTQVRNAGTVALVVSAVQACAGTSAEFSFTRPVPFTVDPGASVPVDVAYTPTDLGADTGCVAFSSNDPSTPVADLAVSGTGITQPEPVAAVSPTALDFGSVTIGAGASHDITVRNDGTGTLHVSAVALASGTSSEFTWSPAAPFDVAAGASATVTVTYKPTDTGTDGGAIVLTTNDPAAPTVSVTMTGAGAAPHKSSGGCSAGGGAGTAGGLALAVLALIALRRRTPRGRVTG